MKRSLGMGGLKCFWAIALFFLCAENAQAQGPDITYTPLEDGCGTGTRTLTATITDADGVPTSGAGLPVLYYKINNGTYSAVTATYPGSGNDYTFSGIGSGGFVGAIIYYYIVAQDNLGNVSVYTSTGASGPTTNPPAVTTPPDNPDFYLIRNTLAAGTYTISPTGDFTTITDAVNAYNNSCLAGHVEFVIMKPVITVGSGETYPITINYNSSASPSRTLTIKPGLTSVTILDYANEAFFRLNGAQYVTIDGSYNGTNSRNLMLNNLYTAGTSIGIWITSTATRGSNRNVIKNVNIKNDASISSAFGGIVLSGPNNPTEPAIVANSNNTIQNNSITKARYGILLNGAATNDAGNTVYGNWLGNPTSNNAALNFNVSYNNYTHGFRFRGLSVSNQNNLLIDSNFIVGVWADESFATDVAPPALLALEGNISNTTISRNHIALAKNDAQQQYVFGIFCMPDNVNNNIRIFNNTLSRISCTNGGTAADPANAHAIGISGGTGYRIWYNSIHMSITSQVYSITSCLYLSPNITASSTILELKNNIFSNQIGNGQRYSVYVSNPTYIFPNIDYNNYYSKQFVGYHGGNRATLTEWAAVTGQDAHSVNINPVFTSATDLSIANNSPMNELGTPIPAVLKDYKDDVRDVVTPDIGADEIVPPPCSESNGGTATVNTTMICYTGSPILFATGYSYGYGISYQWQMSSDNVTFTNIAGEENPVTATSPVITNTTYYRLAVTCSGNTGYSNVITVNVYSPEIASSTSSASRCGIGKVTLNATGTTGAGVRWYDVPDNGAVLGTANNFVTPVISENTTFYVEAFQGGVTGQVGVNSPTAQGGTIQKGLTSLKVYFKVNVPTKLISLDVFPYGAGEVSTLTIRRKSDDFILASIPFTTTVSGGATAQTISVNLKLDVGEYTVWTTHSEDFPISGMARNITGGSYPYPNNSTSPIQITGNEFNANYYLYYYRWRYTTACESSRVPINVTLTTPPAVDVSSSSPSVCSGNPVTLSATSPNTNYIYSWSPGNIPGATVNVSPTDFTTYTVTANDGVCANTASISIAMNAMPEPVTSAPDQIKCKESAALPLTVSGGVIRGEPLLFENFNEVGSTPPTGWYISTDGSNGISGRFTKQPDGYSPGGYVIHSNDNSQFYLTDVQLRPTHTSLRTPKMDFSTFVNVNMTFWHHYRAFMSDTIFIEISTLPSPQPNNHDPAALAEWTTIKYYTVYAVGGPTNFFREEIDLSAWAGEPNVYIRFRMKNIVDGEEGFYWALDNVFISGDDLAPSYTWSPLAGLFEDAAGTIPYTGNPVSVVYAMPDTTTNYVAASVAPNGCSSRDTTVVSIFDVGGSIAGDNVICVGGSTNLTFTLNGMPPWSITYTDGTNTFVETGITSSPFVVSVSPMVNTTYTLVSVQDNNCFTDEPARITGSATINLTSIGISSWLGYSSDWFDPNNWCGIIPDEYTDVIIPSGLGAYPEIDGTAFAKNISIALNASLTIDAGHSLAIYGNTTLEGTLTNSGIITLAGNDQQLFATGAGIIGEMSTLVIDNRSSQGVQILKKLNITDELSPLRGDVHLIDTITIRSTGTKTARIGQVGATVVFHYTPGVFIVERYIPDHEKGWQFLSAATFGQTIRQAWQEGSVFPLDNNNPGYGTIITSNLPNALIQGFDLYTPLGNTLSIFNSTNNRWDGVPSTNTEPVSQPKGYMLYVRGDRSVQDVTTAPTAVTMRSTGHIYAPQSAPPSIPITAGKYEAVGNPYASAIDFTLLQSLSTGVDMKFYVWDYSIYGTSGNGGWQTVSSSNGWRPVPGSAIYPSATPITRIQSGQAFIVYNTSGGGNVQFNESIKISGEDFVFRNTNLLDRGFLFAHLYNRGGMADGNLIVIGDEFSNAVDADDAVKIITGAHQFGLRNSGTRLSVEARGLFDTRDTVFYDIRNLSAGQYTIRFNPENLETMEAWIVDQYLGTETPVSLVTPGEYTFTVDAQAASKAADRFYIIFTHARPVPVTITTLEAETQETGIQVQWNVENEISIQGYDVQHSTDGVGFTDIAYVASNGGLQAYTHLHGNPAYGINFYRLRIHEADGSVKYSSIVSAMWQNTPYQLTVYPNPLQSGQNLIVAMQHLPAGKYLLRLLNATMQLMATKTVQFELGVQNVQLPTGKFAPGVYYLIIQGEGIREKRMILIK